METYHERFPKETAILRYSYSDRIDNNKVEKTKQMFLLWGLKGMNSDAIKEIWIDATGSLCVQLISKSGGF